MRIVLTIHHHLDRNSGAPGSTIALAEAYERAGHEAAILSYDDFPRRLNVQGRMLAFPVSVAARLGGSLGRWCDLVDSSTGDAWLWSLRRPARSGGPILLTRSHGLEHREHREWLRDHDEGRVQLRRRFFLYHGGERLREVALSLRRADLAFFLNRDDLDFSVARLGVRAERAHLVRDGLDASMLGLPTPRASGSRKIRLALIARHTTGMGADYYVPALELLLRRHPTLRVSLLGGGVPEMEVRASFAPTERSRIDVVPTYDRAELPMLLAGHEILVSAKFSEAFGKALVEAMACGLVPVAAAAAGPSRIIADGKTGLLVPPRNVEALVDAVERLIADPGLLLRLRRSAHAEAQRYAFDDVVAEQLSLLAAARARRSTGSQATQRPVDEPVAQLRDAPSQRNPQAPPNSRVEPNLDGEQVA